MMESQPLFLLGSEPSREVCCLVGALICSITERLLSPVKPTEHHLLPLCHVGSSDTATGQLRTTETDHVFLRAMLKGSGALVVVSSILPVKPIGAVDSPEGSDDQPEGPGQA